MARLTVKQLCSNMIGGLHYATKESKPQSELLKIRDYWIDRSLEKTKGGNRAYPKNSTTLLYQSFDTYIQTIDLSGAIIFGYLWDGKVWTTRAINKDRFQKMHYINPEIPTTSELTKLYHDPFFEDLECGFYYASTLKPYFITREAKILL